MSEMGSCTDLHLFKCLYIRMFKCLLCEVLASLVTIFKVSFWRTVVQLFIKCAHFLCFKNRIAKEEFRPKKQLHLDLIYPLSALEVHPRAGTPVKGMGVDPLSAQSKEHLGSDMFRYLIKKAKKISKTHGKQELLE